MKWLSIHFYYQNNDKYDEILTTKINELVRTLYAEKVINKFFFIRYWFKGNHLRLRFLIDEENEYRIMMKIKTALEQYCIKYPSENIPMSNEVYEELLLKELNQNAGETIQYNNLVVVENYIPELIRYGGKNNIQEVESIFSSSSLFVIDLLNSFKPSQKQKLFLSMNLILLFIEESLPEYTYEQRIELLNKYILSWRQYEGKADLKTFIDRKISISDELLNRLNNYNQLPNVEELKYDLNPCFNRIKKNLKNKDELEKLILSILHMNNNRMGLSIKDEIISALYLVNYFKRRNEQIAKLY